MYVCVYIYIYIPLCMIICVIYLYSVLLDQFWQISTEDTGKEANPSGNPPHPLVPMFHKTTSKRKILQT